MEKLTPDVSRYLAGIKNTPYFQYLIFRDDGTFGAEYDSLVKDCAGLTLEELQSEKLSQENRAHIKRALQSVELISKYQDEDGEYDRDLIYEAVMQEELGL